MNSEEQNAEPAGVPKERKTVTLPSLASFELRFKGKENIQLIETRFRFAPDDMLSVLKLSNNQKLGFQWTPAVKALSLCFIKYVVDSVRQNPADFKFSGPASVKSTGEVSNRKSTDKSSVASLGQALGKKPIWVEWMFKSEKVELKKVIKQLFGGHNREGKNKSIDVTVTINSSRLPPNRVKLLLNDAPLTTTVDLHRLRFNIQNQCREGNQSITPPEIPSIIQPLTDVSKSIIDRPAQHRSLSRMPPRENKSLADWFSYLTSNQILGYIRVIKASPKHKAEALYEELHDPQCINVLAEKLVQGPLFDMLRFYENYHLSPLQKLLHAICDAIDSNSALRTEHFRIVAQSDFFDIQDWAAFVQRFFPGGHSASMVEDMFIQFAKEPDFKTKHNNDNLQDFCFAIEGFAMAGCKRAINILRDVCFEDNCRLIKDAISRDPSSARLFVRMIGKNEFQAQLEKSLTKKELSVFQSQLNMITSNEG